MSRDTLETKQRILKATLDLLESGGGQGVRMSDIAKRAGISRQAVYLHFATRAELLIATTNYLDETRGREERLAPSRTARSGVERLDAYIEVWGDYIPEIYGVAKALLAMKDTDEAAAVAWDERMQAMRHGCEAAISALDSDGVLSDDFTLPRATDMLWTLLSVRNWEHLTIECGWTQEAYVEVLKSMAHRSFVKEV